MGIRFNCHVCNKPLHVKFFQAGKRGRCPHCQNRFRVPNEDADFSIPLESPSGESAKAEVRENPPASTLEQEDVAAVATLEQAPVAPLPVESPKKPAADSEARWFVRPPSGGVYGPADTRTLTSWIAQRRVTADSYIWREGMEIWRIAIELMPDAFGSELGTVTEATAPPPVVAPTERPSEKRFVEQDKITSELSNAPVVKAKANLDLRRRKKQKQTWIIFGLLIAIALGLIATLIVVLRG